MALALLLLQHMLTLLALLWLDSCTEVLLCLDNCARSASPSAAGSAAPHSAAPKLAVLRQSRMLEAKPALPGSSLAPLAASAPSPSSSCSRRELDCRKQLECRRL